VISLANFEPYELDLPEHFDSFRPAQIEAIEQIANDPLAYQMLDLPTGSGKTLIAIAAAKVLGVRAVIATATLGLEQQYMREFESIGLVNIHGKNNYHCELGGRVSCRWGKLEGCPNHKRVATARGTIETCSTKCPYEAARKKAQWAPLVVTNYAYWIRANERGKGLEPAPSEGVNPVGLLILDEAHKAVEELSRTLQIVIKESLLQGLKLPYEKTDSVDIWRAWANGITDEVDLQYSVAIQEYKRKKTLGNKANLYNWENAKELVEKLLDVNADQWVCEAREGTKHGRSWTFDPIWPAQWSQKLFCGVPKVVLMSATLRPITGRMLGIPKESISFREWPRVFPAKNTPVYHLATTRLNHKAKQEDIDKWVNRIDEIISGRLDRKGLIHTVSYQRQKYLIEHSKFGGRMVANSSEPDSESATQIFERFKQMGPGSILVSPSFSTGWDFPGADCEYQIIAKLPFPDTRNKLMQARLERNAQYVNYLAMQDLVQAAGRGTRSYQDWCEVFIVDDSISWFFFRNKALAPRWFNILNISQVPVAPQKIA
jgi:Rad3-related DNA helicase